VKLSSDADWANLDRVRRWPVDDLLMVCSSGFSRCVETVGRAEWSRVGARIESEREMAMESGRGFAGGEMEPS
jgi:hypothetical protein